MSTITPVSPVNRYADKRSADPVVADLQLRVRDLEQRRHLLRGVTGDAAEAVRSWYANPGRDRDEGRGLVHAYQTRVRDEERASRAYLAARAELHALGGRELSALWDFGRTNAA